MADRAIAEALAIGLRHRGVDAAVADRTEHVSSTAVVVAAADRLPQLPWPTRRVLVVSDRPVRFADGSSAHALPTSTGLDGLAAAVAGETRFGDASSAEDADHDLTPREVEVLTALADGGGTDEIGRALGISKNTVRSHLKNAMTKLGVQNRAELIAWALRSGVLQIGTESEPG